MWQKSVIPRGRSPQRALQGDIRGGTQTLTGEGCVAQCGLLNYTSKSLCICRPAGFQNTALTLCLGRQGKTSHARGPLHYLSEQVFDKCFLDRRALTAQRSKRKFGDSGWLAHHHPVREWQGQNKGSSILLPASKPSHRRKVTEP